MAKTLQQLLYFKNIIAVIQAIKGGIPSGIIPPQMLNPTKKLIGNVGVYKKVESTRQTAQAVHYGAASKGIKLTGVSEVGVKLIHSFEHFDHDPNTVAQLLSQDGNMQTMGSEEVGNKIRDFGTRFTNLRLAAWYSILFNGIIWLDGEGNLLYSSSGAAITIDFGVPAGNQNQLNWDGNGAIIGASWGTAGTDIASHIMKIQKAAAVLSGYPIVNAYYGQNIPSYIAANTIMKEYLRTNPMANEAIKVGGIPKGFLNLNWIPANTAFYADKDGTARYFCGVDTVVFTPDVSDLGWWGFLEGSYAIPTNIGQIQTDALAALNSLRQVNGMFGFATVTNDPVGIRQYGGDTFLPTLNVPKSIFIADVTP
jgi:hypothetical protein